MGCPTAKSFCGCCHLRVPCIVLASLRMVMYIIAVLAYLYFFVFLDAVFKEKPNRTFKDDQVEILIRVLFFVVCVNIVVTVLFIVGVKAVRRRHIKKLEKVLFFNFLQKNAAKMEYYVIAVGTNALLLMFLFKIILFILAIIECFVFICSYSLYTEYLSDTQVVVQNVAYTTVNTVITNDNDPPLYKNIGSEMQGMDLKQNP